mmetsp:Transcript_27664/g.80882  ORF Transcript_27664/g.80882 Transcript_27664/m.80882 type:complete len:208 (-) Transcript_27664:2543-3166(-)
MSSLSSAAEVLAATRFSLATLRETAAIARDERPASSIWLPASTERRAAFADFLVSPSMDSQARRRPFAAVKACSTGYRGRSPGRRSLAMGQTQVRFFSNSSQPRTASACSSGERSSGRKQSRHKPCFSSLVLRWVTMVEALRAARASTMAAVGGGASASARRPWRCGAWAVPGSKSLRAHCTAGSRDAVESCLALRATDPGEDPELE